MKTILLLRHGKSDWNADYIGDHSRPLAERGEKGARKMGRFLTTARVVPDRALSSTAERARQTLAIAAEAGGWMGPARITDALYEATPQSVLSEIQREPDDAQTLIVVGHEPTWSGLVSLLIGGGRIEMKTAAVARIDVPVERWADVASGIGALAFLLPPAALRPNAYRKLKKTVDSALEAQQEALELAEETAAPKEPPAEESSASSRDGNSTEGQAAPEAG